MRLLFRLVESGCWVRRMFFPLRPHHLSDFEMGFLGLQNVVLGFAMDVVRER